VWVQCYDFPLVPSLQSGWGGDPVEFGDAVSYTCPAGTFFEHDK